MPPCRSQSALPLPRGWRKITRAGVLHAISVAAMAMTSAWIRTSARRPSPQRCRSKSTGHPDPEDAVAVLDAGAFDAALQDSELVALVSVLEGQLGAIAAETTDQRQ